jgi:RNA polymerase sigma factor (sigma-70 family)
MASGRPDPSAVRRLMKLAGVSPGGSATDSELIERFVRDRSEGAFADLMARHGPMVRAVCRRHLRDPHAADDAFQAAFLVLARKAGAVRWRECLGGWLFEVATRVSRKAASQAARRAAREGSPADAAPEPAAPVPPTPADLTALQAALDEELARLPEKLRSPLVLCHLEGLSQDEVARHLGLSDGQLRGRLYRAKERVRERLVRRGFTLTAVLLALTVGGRAAAVPAVLATATLRLCSAPAGALPAAVLELSHGVIRDMTLTMKPLAALALVGLLGLGTAGLVARPGPGADPAAPAAAVPLPKPPVPAPVRQDDEKKPDPARRVETIGGWIKAVAADKNSIRVKPDEDGGETDVPVPAAAKVRFGKQPVAVADLQPGMRVALTYVGNEQTPSEVKASWPRTGSEVRAVDAAKATVTIRVENRGVDFDVPLAVAADAEVVVDRLPAGLADVPVGRKVELELTLDKKSVTAVHADGDKGDIPALVKTYDAAARTLLVEFEAEAHDVGRRVTLCLPVSADAKVRLAGKDAHLTDLKERTPVRLRMTADRKAVAGVLAGNPLPAEKDDD